MARDNECSFQQVSDRIYVIVGSDHKTCPIKEVEHPLTNPAIVVGETGIIVIDPGSSLQVGRLVLEHIRTITDKPVVAVFNTHIHGLYWLGNQAIREQFPDAHIYAHERMIKRVRDGEGDFWIDAITGRHQGGKTGYVIPDIA
ncbi:MAG: MBL fold metallo-hydrolase, partial [Candidatus Promineifilaceae bacterium]